MPKIFPVTCTVCGCLCDDIEITIDNGRVTAAKNACAMGEAKFLNYNKHRRTKPFIRQKGNLVEASLNEAIKKSAKILFKASYPLLFSHRVFLFLKGLRIFS